MFQFKTILLAAMCAALFAGTARSATLSGVFDVSLRNFNAGGSAANAAATEANEAAHAELDRFTYTGALDFWVHNIPRDSDEHTVAHFFATGSGKVSGLDDAIAGLRLSTPRMQITTLLTFTARFSNDFEVSIRHDDGITLINNGTPILSRAAPTAVVTTGPAQVSAGSFRLIYAAANGNPSVLQVTGDGVSVIPLPASAWILLGGLAGLATLARRRHRPAP